MNTLQPTTIEQELLQDDGVFPNNPRFPLLVYRKVFELSSDKEKAGETIKKHFQENGWSNAWTNGIHDYHHYHSNTHEVLGISWGNATVQFGGAAGLITDVYQGDVVVVPAGVAHKCLHGKSGFECIGAYPHGADYDMKYGTERERESSIAAIQQVDIPDTDPVLGTEGGIPAYWK